MIILPEKTGGILMEPTELNESMSLEEIFEEFTMYLKMKDYSQLTVSAYRADFRVFLEYLNKMKTSPTLDKLNSKKIRQFTVYLKMKGNTPATIARKINFLRSFSKFCINEDYLTENPMKKVETPRKEKRVPVYLSNDEMERLLATPTKLVEKTVLYLFAFTGIRRQELVNLDLQHIDLENNLLTVRHGKGNKDRVIPINQRLKAVLQSYLIYRPQVDHPALIIGVYKGRISPTALNNIFQRNLAKSGIKREGLSIHKIRHTFATLLLHNHVDLVTIQNLLGHQDLTTTQIYAHTNMERLRYAVDVLN